MISFQSSWIRNSSSVRLSGNNIFKYMFCFACTGGIGSGKSYVIRIFSALGIPAFIADERVKELYNSDRGLLDKLVGLLGDDILKDGVLQKHIMAKKIKRMPENFCSKQTNPGELTKKFFAVPARTP